MTELETILSLNVCRAIIEKRTNKTINRRWNNYMKYIENNEIEDCEGYEFTKNMYNKYRDEK
jgi:hypothetical protein